MLQIAARHARDGQQGERRDHQAVGDTLHGLRAHVTATAVGIDPVERHLDKPIELLGTVHTVDDFESGGQVGLVNGLGQLVIFARVLSSTWLGRLFQNHNTVTILPLESQQGSEMLAVQCRMARSALGWGVRDPAKGSPGIDRYRRAP